MQSRALDLVASSNLVERLVALDEMPPKADQDQIVGNENFVDKHVLENREQAMAVRAIVERTSGCNPVCKVLTYLKPTGVFILPIF